MHPSHPHDITWRDALVVLAVVLVTMLMVGVAHSDVARADDHPSTPSGSSTPASP